MERRVLIFFLREKKKRILVLSRQESLHKRGYETILAPTRRLSKNQIIDKKIVVWSWSRQLWRQSVDFTLQKVFLKSMSLKLKFWINICYMTFLLHVSVVMPHKGFIWFFFLYFIRLHSPHNGLVGLSAINNNQPRIRWSSLWHWRNFGFITILVCHFHHELLQVLVDKALYRTGNLQDCDPELLESLVITRSSNFFNLIWLKLLYWE